MKSFFLFLLMLLWNSKQRQNTLKLKNLDNNNKFYVREHLAAFHQLLFIRHYLRHDAIFCTKSKSSINFYATQN